ncbi:MAG: hypothetical protein ABIR46_04030 [Candidatus Saccharimonadales bacterium]
MRSARGPTIIELLVLLVLFSTVGALGYERYITVQSIHRDQDRKTAINAIHHNLEEVVRPVLGGYPRSLNSTQLKAMNESLLQDPEGESVGRTNSDYRYEPTGCNGGNVCTGYSLRADLEREADFVKTNPRA